MCSADDASDTDQSRFQKFSEIEDKGLFELPTIRLSELESLIASNPLLTNICYEYFSVIDTPHIEVTPMTKSCGICAVGCRVRSSGLRRRSFPGSDSDWKRKIWTDDAPFHRTWETHPGFSRSPLAR